MQDAPPNTSARKLGSEWIHRAGEPLPAQLINFWQWCHSDLLANTTRGRLAEYLVALDLGVAHGARIEWDAYDLRTPDGVTVEVKSAAYVQSWEQPRPSRISFDIRPTLGWHAATNEYSAQRKRQADAYVFALLGHHDKATIDPLNVDQWAFFVLPTAVLDAHGPNAGRIGLAPLLRLEPLTARFGEIAPSIAQLSPRKSVT